MTKEEIKIKERQLLELTAAFCTRELNDDYLHLCKKLILKLGRKKDVLFKRGKTGIWAAAVVHTIGSINFLFDKSFEPYLRAEQISEYFGTKKSTVSSKVKQIKEMFNLWHFSSEFSTQDTAKNNPFNNMVMADRFLVPLSSLPEELQKMVKKERAEGRDIEFTTNR